MKKLTYLLIFLILLTPIYALINCDGEVIKDTDVPCLILLPYTEACTSLFTDIYYNGSTFIYSTQMSQYSPTQCSIIFNASLSSTGTIVIGTYSFNFSTGDTGKINVEEDSMLSIFNLMVYGFLFSICMVLILFMHLFREEQGTSMVYGTIACALFTIMSAMLLSGFEFIRDVTFFFDINYYLVALFISMALYTGMVSFNLWKMDKKENESGYFD